MHTHTYHNMTNKLQYTYDIQYNRPSRARLSRLRSAASVSPFRRPAPRATSLAGGTIRYGIKT